MIKNNKGITMISLIISIVLMLIIASTLVFNSRSGIEVTKLNNMYADIENLKSKVLVYNSKYGSIPIIKTSYTNIYNIKDINAKDNENYYVIDLNAIENITLNYGKGFNNYSENTEETDIYVINEKSYNIYYIKGIELDGKKYYTIAGNYSNIETPLWSDTYVETKEYVDFNGDIATIPAGFQVSLKENEKVISNGLVIRNAIDLNEFVWIPCDKIKYSRYNFESVEWQNSQEKGEYDTITNSYKIINKNDSANYFVEELNQEEQSVNQYGGFYVARYETGIENENLASDTNANNEESWTGYTMGELVIKKDSKVWNYITKNLAKTKAESLYTKAEENVDSKLCSSYAWDTILKFVQTEDYSYPINSMNGTYETEDIQTTGKSVINNIYDLAGNVEEWTTENYSVDGKAVSRGGNYTGTSATTPAANRNENNITIAGKNIGFRIVLYL